MENPLGFRIGIHLGDVISDGKDTHGEGVNIAARIEALAQPGGINITGSVYEQVRNRLNCQFEDMGEHEVKHVSAPVHVYRVKAETSSNPAKLATTSPALPDKPSIAVLPFHNASSDPEQEYFADGMTEDIITELSRFDDLFVIARNSSFAFKNQQTDVRTIARELGIGFVLEGSIRKAGQQVRITARLIRADGRTQIWAEKYDSAVEDVFELQDRVTSQVVGAIFPQIQEALLNRNGRTQEEFDKAHELAWKAQATRRSAFHELDAQRLDMAMSIASKAIDMNSKCSVAYQVLCYGYTMKNLYRWGDNPGEAAKAAEAWAEKFLLNVPGSYMAHHCLGLARFRLGKYEQALRDFQYAHEQNSNDTEVLRFWAWCEACAGAVGQAKEHALMALRLSPKDPHGHVAFLALAMSAFVEGDDEALENWCNKAIRDAPSAPIRRALMIAYAAQKGNEPLMQLHSDALLQAAPGFIGSVFRGENRVYVKPEHMDLLLDGLRKAGFS